MKNVSLTINGKNITAPEGEKLLWVALDNGIYILNLCAIHDAAAPFASCRLCFVEIDGYNQPVTACTTAVKDGMVVNTNGPKALKLVHAGFELLMASHPVDCGHCAINRACELQKIAIHLKVKLDARRLRKQVKTLPLDESNPLFIHNPNKCVLCGRCAWVCQERVKQSVIGFAHRGFDRTVTTFADGPIDDPRCQECGGQCVPVCPAGALVFKPGQTARRT